MLLLFGTTIPGQISMHIVGHIKQENILIKKEPFDPAIDSKNTFSKDVLTDIYDANLGNINIIKQEIKQEYPDEINYTNNDNSPNLDHTIKTELCESAKYENVNYSWHSAWDDLF